MLTPVQRLYREISQPSPAKPAPNVQAAAPAIELHSSDVDAILRRKRGATPEELQFIVQHAREFQLSSWQVNDLSVRLSVELANRARNRTTDPSADFLRNTLHVVTTPAGLLHDAGWVQREMRAGANAIAACKQHRPPRCVCWREGRERLWFVQDAFGEKSPEGWAATRLWELFEQYELASRPERTLGLNPPPQQILAQEEDVT